MREGRGEGDGLLWPNLEASLEAPTTAKEGREKKARAAVSPAILYRRLEKGMRLFGDLGGWVR